ncbi:MAG: thioredoxin-like domain-containing protein, partial [Bacteroidia bacterium]
IYLIATADKRLLFDFVVTDQEFSLETDTTEHTKNMKVKNSPENDAFFDYSKFTLKLGIMAGEAETNLRKARNDKDTAAERKFRTELSGYDEQVRAYRKKSLLEHPGYLMSKLFRIMEDVDIPPPPVLPNGKKDSLFQYYYFHKHYFDHFDFTDDRIVYTPVFFPKFEAYIKKLTIQIPDSISSAADYVVSLCKGNKEVSKFVIFWITNQYETSEYMGMDAVFVHMALTYYQDSSITYWVDQATRFKIVDRAQTLNYNLMGKVGQNLTMPDTNGIYQSLYNIKANYTILLFWDSHCGRCKEEVPKLLDLYKSENASLNLSKTKNVEVYAVGMTNEEADWKKYIGDHKLPWVNVHDPNHESNFRRFYDVYSTPVIYLLDENKKIVAKRLSVEQMKDFIDKHEK